MGGRGGRPPPEQLHLQRRQPVGEGADVVVDRAQRPVQGAAEALPGVRGDQGAAEGQGVAEEGGRGGVELSSGRRSAAGGGLGTALLGRGRSLDEIDEEVAREVEPLVLAPVEVMACVLGECIMRFGY